MCQITNYILGGFLAICSISDWKYKGVHTKLLIGMTVGVVLTMLWQRGNIWLTFLGAILGGLCFLFSYVSKEAFGYADSWLVLLLGVYLGATKVLLLLVFAFLLSGIVCLIGACFLHWKRTTTIPFIPFLTIAYAGVLFL